MLDEPNYSKILGVISTCKSTAKLYNFIDNAERKNVPIVLEAAIRRLASLVPDYAIGSFEYDFWKTLRTYELVLREDGQTNARLFKTREKVECEGIEKVLSDWAMLKLNQWVFDHLIEKGMSDLTGESVILRHKERFAEDVIEAATQRLNLKSLTFEDEIHHI